MIARTWRGWTAAADADAYLDHLHRTGLAEYRATPGNRGVIALRRVRGDRAEFLLLTLWSSEDAVRRFAGANPERAVFYPDDFRYLVEADRHVDHFEVIFEAGRVNGGPPDAGAAPGDDGEGGGDGRSARAPRGAGMLGRFVAWWARVAAPVAPGGSRVPRARASVLP